MHDDDRGFSRFFTDEYPSILRVTFVIVGSWHVAQEVTQEAFTKAFVRWRRISSYDRPGAWVRRVAIRDAVRHRNRAARSLPVPDELIALPLEVRETADLLADLTPRQRAVVALHYLEDRSIAEVAAELGCSESTVRTHLQRARTVLATALAESTGGSDA